MPTIVDILTFISMINTTSERLKDIENLAIILVPLIMILSRTDRSKVNLYLVIMTPLQGAIKWFHESDKILIFILVKEIVLYTGKSPLEAPLSL